MRFPLQILHHNAPITLELRARRYGLDLEALRFVARHCLGLASSRLASPFLALALRLLRLLPRRRLVASCPLAWLQLRAVRAAFQAPQFILPWLDPCRLPVKMPLLLAHSVHQRLPQRRALRFRHLRLEEFRLAHARPWSSCPARFQGTTCTL